MITQIKIKFSEKILARISDLVNQEIAKNPIYQESLIATEMINLIYRLFTENIVNIEQVSDDNLAIKINKILSNHTISGMLNDLTPEQIIIFDESVKGN